MLGHIEIHLKLRGCRNFGARYTSQEVNNAECLLYEQLYAYDDESSLLKFAVKRRVSFDSCVKGRVLTLLFLLRVQREEDSSGAKAEGDRKLVTRSRLEAAKAAWRSSYLSSR